MKQAYSLEIKRLKKLFPQANGKQLEVLKDVNLQVKPECFVAIMGPNGSGKTTLINLICGDITPDEGNIWIEGINVTKWPSYKRFKFIGRVHQDSYKSISSNLTVEELIAIAQKRQKSLSFNFPKTEYAIDVINKRSRLLATFLYEIKDIPAKVISGGQRQLLCIALSILGGPRVILLDEHMASLDEKHKNVANDIVKAFVEVDKGTVLAATHNYEWAHEHCDRIILVDKGIAEDISEDDKRIKAKA